MYFDANGQLTEEGSRLNAMDPTLGQENGGGSQAPPPGRQVVGPGGKVGIETPNGIMIQDANGNWIPVQ